jgi:hypothetical protein
MCSGLSLKPEPLRPTPPLFLNEDELFWLNPAEDLHQFAFDKVRNFSSTYTVKI